MAKSWSQAPKGSLDEGVGQFPDRPACPLSTDGARREFLAGCTAWLTAAAAVAAARPAGAQAPMPRLMRYSPAILADARGEPLRAARLKARTNYIFHYPFIATPCLLLDLGRDVGGVGRKRSIVAFSAICSHKLAYPAREVSFIRFQDRASAKSAADHIHCCADHSVYDPAQGARVVSGPAPEALAEIVLEHDAGSDTLRAVGVRGTDQFEPFFRKYEFKLAMELGARVKEAAGPSVKVEELTAFCRNIAQC
ncbi:MAG: (2Fe-2S)-binding protein [Casimicrobiaceae bacterium]